MNEILPPGALEVLRTLDAAGVRMLTYYIQDIPGDDPADESPAVSLRIRVEDGDKGGNDDGAR